MREETVDREYFVYCHRTPSRKRYIGISKDPHNRWGAKGCNYKKNYRFWRAIEKYGWDNIEHVILFEKLTVDQAKEIEISLIEKWELTDFNHGYNLRDGGDGSFSLHSRDMMSKSRMENSNCVGRKYNDESRNKISESLKEYYKTHEVSNKSNTPKPVVKMDLDGNVIAKYGTIKEASEEEHLSHKTITKCCKGIVDSVRGFKWAYGR